MIYNVSYFKRVTDIAPVKDVSIDDIFKMIGNGKLKDVTELIRNETDKDKRQKLKVGKLPAITISGTFNGSHKAKDLNVYSGLIQIDIDVNYTSELMEKIRNDKFTFAVWKSPSNNIKAIVKVKPAKELHLKSFLALQQYYFDSYSIEIDSKCKDISRLCFLNSDNDIFVNKESLIFSSAIEDVEKVIKQINDTKIDITTNYNDWISIGFAFADEFGASGRNYFHEISKHYINYKYENCDNQYTECLKNAKGQNIKPFFSIAKNYGIDIISVHKIKPTETKESPKVEEPQPKETTNEPYYENTKENKAKHDFYKVLHDSNGIYKDLKIDKVKLIEKIKSFGIYRYDLDLETSKFIQIKGNLIKEISDKQITDLFEKYILELKPYCHKMLSSGGKTTDKIITSEIIKGKIYENLEKYFSAKLLERLNPDKKIEILKDTKDEKFLFFKNGYVTISKDGYVFTTYEEKEIDKYVWSDQVMTRDFKEMKDKKGYFEQFCNNISGQKPERLLALKTIIGYNVHNFMETKLYATILTDSKISEMNEANGRTGKTLFVKGIGQILNSKNDSTIYTEVNGRDLKNADKHKYSKANIDTQLIHLNDVYKNFIFESIYNDITEGISVDKKNQKPFSISVKMIISANMSIIIEGDSSKDRCRIFELSEHYHSKFTPEDEFKHWFFRDWDANEWNRYYTFMINSIIEYFKQGSKIIEPESISIHLRTILEHTSPDFFYWFDDKVKNYVSAFRYYNKDVYSEFIKEFPDYKITQKAFTTWINKYIKYAKDKKFIVDRNDGKACFRVI